MLRRTSPIQTVLVYATFFTLSVMIHMVLVWPRPQAPAAEPARAAPVSSEQPAAKPASSGSERSAREASQGRAPSAATSNALEVLK